MNKDMHVPGLITDTGCEIVAFWKPIDWLGIDTVYTGSHAKYLTPQEDPDVDAVTAPIRIGHDVEGLVASAGELGFSAVSGA